MSEAILPAQAIAQENHQTKEWTPAKVTYAVLMALNLFSHIWLMLIGAGIDNIPTYIWILRLLPVPLAIYLGKLWKDRGFQILSIYFLWFFLRSFIPNPGSIFSVEIAESIPGALWLFAGCYGLAKILAISQLKRFFIIASIVWIIWMAFLCCLGIYVVWTEQQITILRGTIQLFDKQLGFIRLGLIYVATVSGAMMSITILIGIILALSVKKQFCKITLFILLVPIIIAMATTDSRTAFISISTGLAIMAFSRVFKYLYNRTEESQKKKKQWRNWLLSTLAMIIIFLLVMIIILQIAPALNHIRTKGIIPEAMAEEIEKTDVATRGFISGHVLSGRAELWADIIKYIDQNRIILLEGTTKQAPLLHISSFYGHCHCLYLQVLLESGIPGLLLVLSFIVYTIINSFRAINNAELPVWLRLLPAILGSLLIADLVECFLWLRASYAPMTTIFFISAGILNTLIPRRKAKQKLLAEPAA